MVFCSRLKLFLMVALTFSTLLSPFFPNRATAQSAYEGDPLDKAFYIANREYHIFRSVSTLLECNSNFASGRELNGAYDYSHPDSGVWREATISVGLLFSEAGSDGRVDCRKQSELAPLIKALGFDGVVPGQGTVGLHADFLDFFWPLSDCQGDRCPFKFANSNEAFDALVNYLKSQKIDGTDFSKLGPDTEMALSNAANYYYYDAVFKKSNICNGKYYATVGDLVGGRARGDDDNTNDENSPGNPYQTIVYSGEDGVPIHISDIANYPIISFLINGGVRNLDSVMSLDGGLPLNPFLPGPKIDIAIDDLTPDGCASFARVKQQFIKDMMALIAAEQIKCQNSGRTDCLQGTTIGANDPLPNDEQQGAAGEEDTACQASGFGLGWLLCSIINLVDDTIGRFMNSHIEKNLSINTDEPYWKEGGEFYQIWNGFRVIANILFVLAFFAVIFGQAFSLMEAYTVKKALPRLLIAAVLVQLSWVGMVIIINAVNALGEGTKELLFLPFDTDPAISFGEDSDTGIIAGLFTVGAGIAGLIFGLLGLISFAIPIVTAIILAFATIVFRNMVVYAMVMFAPIAIVAYALPGTEKLARTWFSLFIKALLMYPFIMALIALGAIMGQIGTEQANASEMATIIGIALYFAPYFAIPFAMRFAGGAIATIGGFMNDKSKGLVDRSRQWRGQRAAQNWADTKGGNRFKGENPLSKRASHGLQTATLLPAMGLNPWKAKSRIAGRRSALVMDEAKEAIEKNSALRNIFGSDDMLEAGIYANTDQGVRKYLEGKGYKGEQLEQSVAQVREAQRGMSHQAFKTAAVIGNASTGTGYAEGAGQMYEAINMAAGNDRNLATQMLNEARSRAEQAGRGDLRAGSFNQGRMVMESLHSGTWNPDIGKDGGTLIDSPGTVTGKNGQPRQETAAEVARRWADRETIRTQGLRGVLGARAPVSKRLAKQMFEDFHKDLATGDQDKIDEHLAKFAAAQDALGNLPPEIAQNFSDAVLGQTIRLQDGSSISVNEYVDARRGASGDTRFQQLRREYGRGLSEAASREAERANGVGEPPVPPVVPPIT